jgi:hypothetical protein
MMLIVPVVWIPRLNRYLIIDVSELHLLTRFFSNCTQGQLNTLGITRKLHANAALQQVLLNFRESMMNTTITHHTNTAAPGQKVGVHRESGRLLAALLFAATVAGLAVASERLMATWANEHLLKTWLAMWSVVFAGSLLFAGTARRMAHRVMDVLNNWARKRTAKRAAARQSYLLLEREAQRNPQQAAPAAPAEQVPARATARMRGRQFDLYYV